jgi:hypothetical protein
VCKTADTSACKPFKTTIRVEDDRVNGKLPTMSMAKLIMGMLDAKQIDAIPGWGFKIQVTSEVAQISLETEVRWCTHKGMCTLHISPTGTSHNPMGPMPLGIGDHEVTVVKGAMWRISRTGPGHTSE